MHKALEHNQKKWKDRVKVCAISIKTSHEIVPQLIDAKKWDLIEHYYRDVSKCFEDYGINSVPQVILVDKEGTIAYKGPGFKSEKEYEESVRTLLEGNKLPQQIERAKKLALDHDKRLNRKSKIELASCEINKILDQFGA